MTLNWLLIDETTGPLYKNIDRYKLFTELKPAVIAFRKAAYKDTTNSLSEELLESWLSDLSTPGQAFVYQEKYPVTILCLEANEHKPSK